MVVVEAVKGREEELGKALRLGELAEKREAFDSSRSRFYTC
jgi:hypothetical protein